MNRLKEETSPYLLQHADNPVHWYPWCDDAFAQAFAEDKPMLLSVGYSSCHWCHVMAHESFEHAETAALMNEHFINIKVDREERPDIDTIYMTAVQILTKSGGWPMTVFLLPDGRPFHGGTYFPLEPRFGMPSFRQVLSGIAQIYNNRRDEVERVANQLTQLLRGESLFQHETKNQSLTFEVLKEAQQEISAEYDQIYGGFSHAPKFPQPMIIEFLSRQYVSTDDKSLLNQITHTLIKMAQGGIYDQIGGGFARYSVDEKWLVPHFEKMLYDNAQLSRVYLNIWQLSHDHFFRRIAAEIYEYVLREMTATFGGFYSATDADSEGIEGKYFVWEKKEIEKVLGEDTELFGSYWGITDAGNFEGKNILYLPMSDEEFIEQHDLLVDEWKSKVKRAKRLLYQQRSSRIPPFLDDKVLTSWNGLMLASIAEAARVLDSCDLRDAANKAGDFLIKELKQDKNVLLRTFRKGESKIRAFLEDYACLIDGLIELYQLTFDEHWFLEARRLADYALANFKSEDGVFYDTSDHHESLVARSRNLQDGAFPSANAHFAKQLLRFSAYTGEAEYENTAVSILNRTVSTLKQFPAAIAGSLNALHVLLDGTTEVAIIGDPSWDETKQLLSVLEEEYRPNMVRALTTEASSSKSAIPLLKGRRMIDGKATAFVCRKFKCRLPVTHPDDLRKELGYS